MRLAEMLSYADIDQLHELARAYACDCNINSKNELIQSLLASIKRQSSIEQQLDGLNQAEFNFLMHIVLDGRQQFSLEDLRVKAKFSYPQELDRATYRKLVSVALKKGWVFRGVTRQASSSFEVPADMRKIWADEILRRELGEQPAYPQPYAYRDEGFAMIEDMRLFLRYVLDHEPTLTVEGVIYRRNQQQLFELLAAQEEPIEKGGWRFGYGRHFREYPDRFSLIYDFCYYRGYIREEPGHCLYVTNEAQEANELPAEWLAMELYKFWLRLYKRPVVGLPMLTRLIGRAAQQWVSEEILLQMITPRVRAFYYDQPDSIARQRILKMMVHLGLLRKGLAEPGGAPLLYQTTTLGQKLLESVEGSAMKDIILDPEN
ncbi:hypothetical protein BEP19_01955 [Ammoniphilus oxalaticus]|uniref:Helicase XPB/Ssl2 N-terminal domain-containing protein n=1 Tax=Ammoniphilus oxalaticus TaxID=66863 RepID=A0A419SN43_9BACL|nr:hypothetical protein [Ammoniphilus oxalaticus]RKD25730.1 hypothetical protein BEP19_01955 [Ammoniphilus oxalaticus]